MLYCTVLFCTVLYCTVLYCTVLCTGVYRALKVQGLRAEDLKYKCTYIVLYCVHCTGVYGALKVQGLPAEDLRKKRIIVAGAGSAASGVCSKLR